MKKTALLFLISLVSSMSFAEVPKALAELIPVGGKTIQMRGYTHDNRDCQVQLSHDSFGFSASVGVLKSSGFEAGRFGKFQIGFGHELQSLIEGEILKAVSTHEAEESYSSDSRATLTVSRKASGHFEFVAIMVESKGWFGYSEDVNEACYILEE